MPVLSPHRSSASALAGSYRSTFSSSGLDRPYYRSSSSYSPHVTTYSERYRERSYFDTDGHRVYSRSGSITEDGITTRFREEGREPSVRRDSLSRDSGISSIRENSIMSDYPRRESSISRDSGRLSAINVSDSVAELRNKYSPANYVPACLRNNHENNISRSKSVGNNSYTCGSSDLGLPPLADTRKVTIATRNGVLKNNANTTNKNGGLVANNNNNNVLDDDVTNGNNDAGDCHVISVADLRKKFQQPETKTVASIDSSRNLTAAVAETSNGTKLDVVSVEEEPNRSGAAAGGGPPLDNVLEEEDVTVLRNSKTKTTTKSRTNNFASFIPAKDFHNTAPAILKQRSINGVEDSAQEQQGDLVKKIDDISAAKLNSGGAATLISPPPSSGTGSTTTASSSSASAATSSSLTSSSLTGGSSGSGSVTRRHQTNEEIPRTSYAPSVGGGSPSKTQLGLNGLKNIGNTCFMNSVIQCLSNTKQLMEYLRTDAYVADKNTTTSSMKGALITSFAEVIKEIWSEDSADRVVNTASLKSQIQRFAPRFIGYAQQDAQEFLRYLLEGLHEDVNRVTQRPKPILTEIDEKLTDSEKSAESWGRYLRMDNSKIVDCFVGQLKSTLKCTHCGHCSVTFDPFWDLSLPIPQRAGQVRLSQCLESFTREETLDGDEKPTCSKCKERRKCTKSFTIQKFPKILVIHLKRFSLAERFRGKLSVTVDFPLEGLDVSHYAADGVSPCRYNLYAVSNHSGTTYSGHYTAYCRHPYTKSWHEYNDSRVSSISAKSIVSGEAYVLFYEQEGQKSHL